MTDKLDLSLDEIIVREGISNNGSKRNFKFNENNNKSDNKSGFRNITFQINNSKTESNECEEEKHSNKRKIINDSNGDNWMSKRGNTSMNYTSNSSNNADNNGFHFTTDCGAIFVNNLKYEVTDEDIQQLFGAFGDLKRAAINYQSNGRSTGTAFVVFERKCDAVTAFGSLKNITLDGRPLHLSIVNCNSGNQSSSGGLSSVEQRMSQRVGLTHRISAAQSVSDSSTSSGGRSLWNDMAKNYDNSYGSNESKRNNYRNQRFNSNRNNNDKSDSKDSIGIEDLDADLDSYISKRNITK